MNQTMIGYLLFLSEIECNASTMGLIRLFYYRSLHRSVQFTLFFFKGLELYLINTFKYMYILYTILNI